MMSNKGLSIVARQLKLTQSAYRNSIYSFVACQYQQNRGFFGEKRKTLCDLNKQTTILDDGARKAAWLGDEPLRRSNYEGCLTTYSSYRRGAEMGGKDMLGKRVMEDGKLVWKWITYQQAFEISDHISQSMRSIGIPIGEEAKIGVYSKNRPEWVLADMAIHNFSNVTVPLYDTISTEDMIYISNLTEIPLIFVDNSPKTELILKEKNNMKFLKTIVQFDEVSAEMKKMAESKGVKLWGYEEFVKNGQKQKHRSHIVPTPETLATISFTSGTTGRPKGVILTHGNLCSTTVSSAEFVYPKHEQNVYLSYLPMAHIYERVCAITSFQEGTKIGFFRNDPQYLLDDIQSLGPSTLATVPRVIDKIHKSVQRELHGKPIKRLILKAALAYKDFLYKKTGLPTKDTFVDKYILHKIQSLLGPNLRQVIVGAAKSDIAALDFMRAAFGIQLFEGYGQTETSGPTTILVAGDTNLGTVGPPMTCCLIKLDDVPELGYYVNKNGGEILVKGHNVTSGYYKNEEATKSSFTEDGYLKTGDIGRWTPAGTLEIIDRKKNVFKLPQGKFVAPDQIEALYASSRFVSQIYVHGDLTKPWLVAVLVPDPVHLAIYAEEKHKITGKTLEELCKEPVLAEDAVRHLVRLTEGTGRPRYEGVYAVHLTPTPFSAENDLTTPTMKNKRPRLAAHFKKEIEAMFKTIEANELKK